MDYTLDGRLGAGGEGTTYLATNPIGNKFALKGIDDGDDALREAGKMVEIGEHDNVVRVVNVISGRGVDDPKGLAEEGGHHSYIVMEYLEGRTLADFLEEHVCLAPADWWQLLPPILSGIDHIHRKGFIHRDIKPDNIMLVGDTPKIIDLGLARLVDGTTSRRSGGTPGYRPPEWAQPPLQGRRYDIYQLAVISYEALRGEVPSEPHHEERSYLLNHQHRPMQALGNALSETPANRPRNISDLLIQMVDVPFDSPSDDSDDPLSSTESSTFGLTGKSASDTTYDRRSSVADSQRMKTGDATVASLLEEITEDFDLPPKSIVLRDGDDTIAGGTHLRTLRERMCTRYAHDGDSLMDLAKNISGRYGLQLDMIHFRKPASANQVYHRGTLVKYMKSEYPDYE